jgi:hypothetical protein
VPEGERDGAALAKAVHAEAAEAVRGVSRIEVAGRVEGLALGGRAGGDGPERVLEIAVGQHSSFERDEQAVDPRHRRRAHLEVQVATAAGDRGSEEGVQIHGHSAYRRDTDGS